MLYSTQKDYVIVPSTQPTTLIHFNMFTYNILHLYIFMLNTLELLNIMCLTAHNKEAKIKIQLLLISHI